MSKLQDHYQIGDRVTDRNTFVGKVIKVTLRSVTVKYPYSKVKYTQIKLPDFFEGLKKID